MPRLSASNRKPIAPRMALLHENFKIPNSCYTKKSHNATVGWIKGSDIIDICHKLRTIQLNNDYPESTASTITYRLSMVDPQLS